MEAGLDSNKPPPGDSSRWVPIREAARLLGVSIDTIRRWDEKGIIHSNRLKGRNRYFDVAELERVKATAPLTISEAAKKLGISTSTLRRLEKEGLITPQRSEGGERLYTEEVLHQYMRVVATRRRERKSPAVAALASATVLTKTVRKPGTFFERVRQLFAQKPEWAVPGIALLLIAVAAWGRAGSLPSSEAEPSQSYITWSDTGITAQDKDDQHSTPFQTSSAEGETASSSSPLGQVAGTIAGITNITFENIYNSQPGIERAMTVNDKGGGISFDIYQPAEYLYIDLRDDGTKFVVRDHEHDTLTIDHNKNIIAHGGSKLDIQGTLTLDGESGDANQVLTSQGKDQTPVWKNFGEVTVGGVSCINCLDENQIKDIYVLNTGDEVSGNLTLTGQSDLRFAAPGSSNYVGFQAPGTVNSSLVWTLPGSDGSNGQLLSTNGSGVLSWSTSSGGMTSFTLAGESGTSQTISDGNTLTITAGTGINSVASATDTLTVSVEDDSLDFAQFQDTLDLDAATEVNLGSTNFTFDLDSTGDLVIQDAGTAFVTFSDTGATTFANDIAVNGGDITSSATTFNFDIGNTGTFLIRDGTNNLLTIADAGTTGNVTVTGDLTISGDDLVMGTNTSGAVLVADGTNFNPVVMGGDATIGTTGTLAIAANAVALTTDTTGDYVGTITAGSGIATTGASTGEGIAHSISVSGVGGGNITDDVLDFVDFEDTLDLDAATDINLGANLFSVDMDSTGDFAVRDGTTNVVLFEDDSTVDVTFPAAGFLTIDASTTANTTTTGVLDINVGAGNAAVDGLNLAFTSNDGATAGTDQEAIVTTLTANDADADVFGLVISSAATTNAAAGSYEGLIVLTNAENTAGAVTDAILITTTSGTAGDITDAIDASAADITNALNVGANTITGTSYSVDASGALTLGSAGLDSLTVTTDGTGDGEVALPTGAISSTEILDDTLLEVDLKAVDAAVDEECLTFETTTGDFEWQSCAASSMSSFTLAGDTGTSQTITDANTFTIATGAILTATAGATDTVTISVDADSIDFIDLEDTLDLDAALTLNQTTSTWTQSFTGTTTDGFTYSATSLTSGTGLDFNVTNTHTADAAIEQVQFDLTNAQSTAANTNFAGLTVNFTNNPTVAGNTETALRIQNQATSNTTDNAVAALLTLDNADTSTTGSTVVTDALRIVNTGNIAAGITNAINIDDADITTDLVLQNDESIDNNTDGTINLTATTLQLTGTTFTGNGATTYDAGGANAITIGSADVTAITLTTDGTGSGEVVLPTGSIASGEILDDTILEVDLKAVDTAVDEECLTFETTTGDFEWQACGSGSTAWDAIGDPTGTGAIAFAETVQTLDWNTAASSAAFDGLSISITNDATTDGGTQRLVVIENLDDAISTGTTEALLVIDNADTNEAVTDGLLITAAAGLITDGIDASDAELTNAINVGDNIVLGTTAVIDFTDFDVSADGIVTFASDTAGDQITITSPSGDHQALVVDATTNANTSTAGIIDLNIGAGNAAVDGINVGLTVNDGATAGTDFESLVTTLTADDADADLFGLVISSAATVNAAAGSYEALITLTNAENTAGAVTDALLITTTSATAGDITDAIDASAADITNALNVGANTITGTSYSIDASGTLTLGSAGLDSLTVTTDGTGTAEVALPAGSIDSTEILDGTIAAADVGADVLDFTEFQDTLDVDAATDINLGANLLSVDLDSTGDFAVRDGTTNVVLFEDDSTVDVTFPAAGFLTIDASTTANTTTTGVLDINVGAGNAAVDGINVGLTVNDGATAATDFESIVTSLTANDADADLFGLVISSAATANATAGSYEALITLTNAENTAGAVTDALLITTTSATAGDITDAIDASAADITNALNVGANVILGTTATIDFTDFDVSDDGKVTLAGDSSAIDLSIISPNTTADVVNISAASLTTANTIDIPDLDVLSTGKGLNIASGSEAISSGELLTLALTSSGSANTAKTGALSSVAASRTDTRVTGTTADDYDTLSLSRTTVQNGTGGTTTAAGSVLRVENVATQTAGTLTDTVKGIELVMDADGTGDGIFIDSNATGGISLNIDSEATTADVVVVDGTALTTGDALQISVDDDPMTTGMALRIRGTTTGTTDIFTIGPSGTITIAAPATANTTALCWDNAGNSDITDCNGSATDLAEYFGTRDSTLDAGDLVVADEAAETIVVSDDAGQNTATSKAWVAKASTPYATGIIGVVSTAPNQIYGDDGVFASEDLPRPISLAGRVPLKVSTENGPITVGDPLTSSSIPGVAMRATAAGPVVGKALEPYDGSDVKKIVTFVNVSWYDPAVIGQIKGLAVDSGTLPDSTALAPEGEDALTNKVVGETIPAVAVQFDEAQVLDRLAKLEEKVFASSDVAIPEPSPSPTTSPVPESGQVAALTTLEYLTSGIFSEELTFENVLHLQNNVEVIGELEVHADVTLYANLIVDTVHIAQALNVHGDTNLFGNLAVAGSADFAGELSLSAQQAGRAVIPRGGKEVEVIYTKAFINEPVIQLSASDSSIPYRITDQSKHGFKLFLPDLTNTEITFSWLALSTKEVTPTLGAALDSDEDGVLDIDEATPAPLESGRPEVAEATPASQEGGTLTGPSPTPDLSPLTVPTQKPSTTPSILGNL